MKRQTVAAILCLTLTLGIDAARAQPGQDVSEFVRDPSSYPRSYRELSRSYDASVVPQLAQMLRSKAEEAHWVRIAGLLGAVGDERAVEALIMFIEEPPEGGQLTSERHNAYSQALMSLGLLVNRTRSEMALSYLIESLTPSVWSRRNYAAITQSIGSYSHYDQVLSRYAIQGLAMSGHPRAGEALRSLQQSPAPDQAQLRNGLDSMLSQWLEVYDLVAERGVDGMYEHYDEQRRAREQEEAAEAERLRAEALERQSLREAQTPR